MEKLHITAHKGKLEGIPSLNVSALSNPFCKAMASKGDAVCSKCYARRIETFRATLEDRLIENSRLLSHPLGCFEVPHFNARYVRFNSFGELINIYHAEHLVYIARCNPDTTFALWTKRPSLFHEIEVPDNLVLIHSVDKLDPDPGAIIPLRGFDHAYAVFTKGDPCGEKCLDCLRCYRKEGPYLIRQRLH